MAGDHSQGFYMILELVEIFKFKLASNPEKWIISKNNRVLSSSFILKHFSKNAKRQPLNSNVANVHNLNIFFIANNANCKLLISRQSWIRERQFVRKWEFDFLIMYFWCPNLACANSLSEKCWSLYLQKLSRKKPLSP